MLIDADGTNPVLEKELRSEIFSQEPTPRVVIQVSMPPSIPLMAGLLSRGRTSRRITLADVPTFNLLAGPVSLVRQTSTPGA